MDHHNTTPNCVDEKKYTTDELNILQQAAAILNVPIENLRRLQATAQFKACSRCKVRRTKSYPYPADPDGLCVICQALTVPTSSRIPCLRYPIVNAVIYLGKLAPYPFFSRRWQSMDIVDITHWHSNRIRYIVVTQIFFHEPCPIHLKVKEFVPIEGDLLEKRWTDPLGNLRSHPIPPYALVNMEESSQTLLKFADKNVGRYIIGAVDCSDPLIWATYVRAFRHMQEVKEMKELTLLAHTFRLWMACRLTSNPAHICGKDKLGAGKVQDPTSPWYGYHPLPPVLIAQLECIWYTKLLQPLSKVILGLLQEFILSNRRKYWLTIYLTMFVLLHSCSMITRRDAEYAKQMSLPTEYTNPKSIGAHHVGALTLLAHFHYINQGERPFILALDPSGLQQVADSAQLNPRQVQFVKETALLVQKKKREFSGLRETQAFGHDLYWVSQLFDEEWTPSPTA